MAAKKLPTTHPILPLRRPQDLEDGTPEKALFNLIQNIQEQLNRFRDLVVETSNDHANLLDERVSSGSGAPGTTPTKIGLLFIDTTTPNVYISTGTSSSADWKLV